MSPDRRFAAALRVAIFAALVAACAAEPPPAPDDPEWRLGQSDGCASAQNYRPGYPGGVRRNDALWKQGGAYSQGWRNGWSVCGGL